jgi:uncharacterized protein (TIRG00374 family)
MTGQPPDAAPLRPQRSVWRWVVSDHPYRRGALLVVLALATEYLVLPQIAGVRRSIHLLGRANIGLVGLGVLFEVASLASYVQGIGSALVLNAILWLALIVSVPLTGFNPVYTTAAIVGAVLLPAFAGVVLLVTKGEERAATALRHLVSHLSFMSTGAADTADRVVHDIAARIRVMAADRALLRRAILWAAANWLLDAASLFAFLAAFGHIENPDGLLVAYGLAYVLAAMPVTPGGLGVVEGVLVPSLIGFGATRGIAIVAVIAYRLANFWLAIPVGAAAYLSLQATGTRAATKRRKIRRRALAEAKAQAPSVLRPN